MADGTSGPTESTWKPSGSAYSVKAVPKGASATAPHPRRARFLTVVILQGMLALLLLGAALLVADLPLTQRLYLWAALIPVGFAAAFTRAYVRGERQRARGAWTMGWEKQEARRAYQLLGVTVLVWAVGVGVIFLAS